MEEVNADVQLVEGQRESAVELGPTERCAVACEAGDLGVFACCQRGFFAASMVTEETMDGAFHPLRIASAMNQCAHGSGCTRSGRKICVARGLRVIPFLIAATKGSLRSMKVALYLRARSRFSSAK